MRVIVTCGPSFEPIDEVRRLTNFSTGELGTLLSQALARAGHEVICLRGQAASFSANLPGAQMRTFTTNDDLAQKLAKLSAEATVEAFFHTAALSDFRVARVRNSQGEEIQTRKIPSRQEKLTIELIPSTKIIHQLRTWFPQARIVGWKYELEGSRPKLLTRAERQISESQSDACVLNGEAYGPGFGFFHPGELLRHLPDKTTLCQHLVSWLGNV